MSDYLDRVEAQLRELTEHGAQPRRRMGRVRPAVRAAGPVHRGVHDPRPPRRRRSEALAFLAAFAVAAAVVVIVAGNVHSGKPHRTAATAPVQGTTTATNATTKTGTATTVAPKTQTGPASAPVPAHFAPQSFTAIGELIWWLLGPAPCTAAGAKPPCAAILRTTDGGRNFTGIPAPQAPLSTSASAASGYSQLRFADASNGFAYGPDLYVTHDGGASWHPVDLGGTVTDLAISAGAVYATVESAQGGGRLVHSPADRDAWTTVTAAGAVSGGLWVQDSQVIVQSGIGTGAGGNVLVSNDGGQSFTAHPAPSPGLPCQFAAPEPPVVWAHCATGTESGVWRSTDNGAQFTIAAGTGTSLGLPNSAAFAAASATTAVVGYKPLYRSSNGGVLWIPVGPPGIAQWADLEFTDATHGIGLGYVGTLAPANEQLFYTTDGGQSYHLVPLP
jgi:photosystem II stability/assembly factor-like uncharacterized protein